MQLTCRHQLHFLEPECAPQYHQHSMHAAHLPLPPPLRAALHPIAAAWLLSPPAALFRT
jgi:hypothetical protein